MKKLELPGVRTGTSHLPDVDVPLISYFITIISLFYLKVVIKTIVYKYDLFKIVFYKLL